MATRTTKTTTKTISITFIDGSTLNLSGVMDVRINNNFFLIDVERKGPTKTTIETYGYSSASIKNFHHIEEMEENKNGKSNSV